MPTSTAKRLGTKTARAKGRRLTQDRDSLAPLPIEKTNLTPAERALLADPNFVTEDEADLIICQRRARRGGRMISLEQLLKRYGRKPRRHVGG